MICPQLSGIDLDGKLVKVECLKHECPKYTQVMGSNPNTGQEISEWKCADAWVPLLLIENSMQQHQTGAAVESFRNEMASDNRAVLALAGKAVDRQENEPRLIG